jgi:hypothetical protein
VLSPSMVIAAVSRWCSPSGCCAGCAAGHFDRINARVSRQERAARRDQHRGTRPLGRRRRRRCRGRRGRSHRAPPAGPTEPIRSEESRLRAGVRAQPRGQPERRAGRHTRVAGAGATSTGTSAAGAHRTAATRRGPRASGAASQPESAQGARARSRPTASERRPRASSTPAGCAGIAEPHRERVSCRPTASVGMSRRLLATRIAEASAPTPTAPSEPGRGEPRAWVTCVPRVATSPKKTKTMTSPSPR